MQKSYKNVSSNELNNIPKKIKKDGVVYYLVNPVWEVSKTEKIGDHDVPVAYTGVMHYEGIKVRTIVKNYKATVSYEGKLEKEVVESITVNTKYEEVQAEENNMIPVAAAAVATGGIIIFSGIILFKRKKGKKTKWKNYLY